jgi:hypothetical protein
LHQKPHNTVQSKDFHQSILTIFNPYTHTIYRICVNFAN